MTIFASRLNILKRIKAHSHRTKKRELLMFEIYSSGADPGFPVGGGANPRRGEGVPTYDVVKVSKKAA